MPRVVDHDERREEILSHCFDLFARQGYAALTMRAIATELGVSTGTLYHYFTGKAALFQAMLTWIAKRDILLATENLPAAANLPDRIEILASFADAHAPTLESALRIALDFHQQQPEAEARGALASTVNEYKQALAEQFGGEDPRLAAALMSFLLGTLVHHMLDPEATSPGHQLRGLLSLSRTR